MSYARFGPGSDVYIFLSVYGGLECCGCILDPKGTWNYHSTKDMLDHLEEHKKAGHKVQDSCIERLKKEAEENDNYIKERHGRTNN